MKITEDVRKYAAEKGGIEHDALARSIAKKSHEFSENSNNAYLAP
jgi:hypothetical protein